jgi:tRNA A37 methylthiotransferase MiaB
MNRSYTVNDFKYCIEKLIKYNHNLEIRTDIMVGFPTETEQDFLDTLRLVEWLGRNKICFQCLTYSPRPNTEASKLPGQLDQKTKSIRFKRLGNLCKFSYVLRSKKLFKKLKRKQVAKV